MKIIECVHKNCLEYDWPTATNCAPIICEGCNRKLKKSFYLCNRWRIDCSCGVVYLWIAYYSLPKEIVGKMGQF